MAKISFFLSCRIENGREHLLERYLKSAADKCKVHSNIEILIKFDDDQDLTEVQKVIEKYREFFCIKYLVTPRGAGYKHLGYFCTELFLETDAQSELFCGQSIDVIFDKEGFDEIILKEAKNKYADGIFVMHTISNLSFTEQMKTVNDAIQRPDNMSIWSRKWIEIQGHFGYNSSVDGFTQLTELLLFKEYGIDRRIDLTKYQLFLELDTVNRGVNSVYWQTKRREAMSGYLQESAIALVRQSAKNIALNIKENNPAEMKELKDEFTSNPTEIYKKYMIESILDAYDSAIRTADKEMQGLRAQINNSGQDQKNCNERKYLKYIKKSKRFHALTIALLILSIFIQIIS